jgi:transposase
MLLVDAQVDVQYKNGGVAMERIPNALYTKELREEAVKMIKESGLKAPEVARRLAIPKSTITYWVKADREGALSKVGRQVKPVTEEQVEVARLKREVAELKMERDFLRKAAAYFAKEPQSGKRS